MSGLSQTKSKLSQPRISFSLKNLPTFLGQWFIRNKFYFLAFAIPVIVMYVAYAIFGVYPYGDKSVLVLDLNGQYVYYFEAIRDAFWGDESMVYNWSRNLSGGYMGVIGYYLASPFTLIPILLPRTMLVGSLQIMILAKVGVASVTFSYMLQKSRNVAPLQSIIFSTLYALCAYGVIQAMNPMWLDGVYLLPLVVLGVEYLVDDGRKLNLIIPLAMIFVFNFYIGYIVAIFTFLYFLFYLFAGRKDEQKKLKSDDYFNIFLRAGIAVGTALLLSAFMILSVYYALSMGKFDFSDPDFSFSTQFNPLDFFPQLLPAQYDSVNVQGLPEIYSGMLTVVLLPLFYLNSKISTKKKIGYSVLLVVLFLCFWINPIDMVWHGFQEPNWLPYRYSFTFSFLIVVMGAMAFSKLDGIKLNAIAGSICAVIALIAISAARENEHLTKAELAVAAALALIYCAIIGLCKKKEKFMAVLAPVVLLTVSAAELGYNAYQTFNDENAELAYSSGGPYYNMMGNDREVVNQIEKYHESHGNENDGYFRGDKTYQKMINDNSAIGLRGLTHSSSVMNAGVLKFIEAMGYMATTYSSKYDGGTPVSDSILGIKYVVDKMIVGDENARRKADTMYNAVFQYKCKEHDGKDAVMDVYENPYALSLGFAADQTIASVGSFGTDNVFNSQNILMSSIAGHTVIENGQFTEYREYLKRMNVDPNTFDLSSVTYSPYGVQKQYTADSGENIDPVVKMPITAETDGEIYIFFQTQNQVEVNLWLGTEKDENGNYTNHRFLGKYFGHEQYHSINLGEFAAGQEFEVRMTITNGYTIVNDFQFYYLDREAFAEDIDMLKQQQLNITEFNGDSLEGTVTVSDGQVLFTTIPYEEGWSVKVDGESLDFIENNQPDYQTAEQCVSKYVNAFLGVKLTPGTHTIEFSYTPPGTVTGVIAFILGLVCVVFIYRYDKKNNKVLIAMYRDKHYPKNNAKK